MARARVLWVASITTGLLLACGGDDTSIPNGPKDGGADSTVDDGSSGGVDSTPPPDVGSDTNPGGGGAIECVGANGTPCDSTTQDCCLSAQPKCEAKGTCTGSSLSCSSAASCPTGDVCCLVVQRLDGGAGDAGQDGGDAGDGGGGNNFLLHSTCAATCPKGELQLCADTNECPLGLECRRGVGGLKACRKPPKDGGIGDASDSG